MLGSISFRIKNWKFAVLCFSLFLFLISLGVWQLSRASQKKLLLKSFAERTLSSPLTQLPAKPDQDLRYHRVSLTGHFDNQHSYLLDNKMVNSQLGYEVYTPFVISKTPQTLLVDRGFVPANPNRKILPQISPILGNLQIQGLLNLPPTYFSWGSMTTETGFPLRVEYIDLAALGGKTKFYPYIVQLAPHEVGAYAIEWQAFVTIPPERHIGYAVQWFALALTLLILFFVSNRRPEV